MESVKPIRIFTDRLTSSPLSEICAMPSATSVLTWKIRSRKATWCGARLVLQGTHTGDGLGIPPTGRKVRVTGLVMARMANGQMVEAWNNWDQLGLLRQVAALPGSDSGDRFTARRA
ncbi:MAG TPA: ester cyclase [Bryobacteraceae bacterium]|nr:ester cyclase [Bryobacteraceae bacterium]